VRITLKPGGVGRERAYLIFDTRHETVIGRFITSGWTHVPFCDFWIGADLGFNQSVDPLRCFNKVMSSTWEWTPNFRKTAVR
jgi:hypothetical protein